MTPKEKTEQLIARLTFGCNNSKYIKENAKKSALIAVDEIIDIYKSNDYGATDKSLNYWQQVKQEIEKL